MNRLLTVREVCELAHVSYPTIDRWLKAGMFPQPVNGRGKKLLWTQSAIEQWMNRQETLLETTPPDVGNRAQKREAKEFERRQQNARRVLESHAANRQAKQVRDKQEKSR